MEVRSYYSTTVEAAMELARKELGPEALLIQSRRSSPELAHLGRYEVVFAGESMQPAPDSLPTIPATPIAQRTPAPDVWPFSYSAPIDLVSKNDRVSKKHDFAEVLASAGISSTRSHNFFDAKPKTRPPEVKRPPASSALSNLARHDLACSPGIGRSGFTETAVAFVGPAGSGKTTTVMKLALMHGLLMSRPVRLFAIDPDRIGTTARLKRFAQILNIEFAEFDTLAELSAAIEKPAEGLTLIDTASYSKYERKALVETANCLLDHAKVETQLVLRVDRKSADNLAAVRFFAPFQAARVVLTGFDDCSDNSDLASLVEAAELPVSFLGVGQRIPEDLEPARRERLAELIRSGWRESVRSAA